MPAEEIAVPPSLQWRAASTLTIALTGLASKAFLTLACTKEVHGLDGFVKVLDERKDVEGRERGLLTGISFLLLSSLRNCADGYSLKSSFSVCLACKHCNQDSDADLALS
jgi:hypothetical protein